MLMHVRWLAQSLLKFIIDLLTRLTTPHHLTKQDIEECASKNTLKTAGEKSGTKFIATSTRCYSDNSIIANLKSTPYLEFV